MANISRLDLVSEAVGCLKRRLELELWLGFIRDSIEKIPEGLIVVKRKKKNTKQGNFLMICTLPVSLC